MRAGGAFVMRIPPFPKEKINAARLLKITRDFLTGVIYADRTSRISGLPNGARLACCGGRSGSSAFDGRAGHGDVRFGQAAGHGRRQPARRRCGGGLTTWALISGYGTRDGLGANGHFTYIGVGNYSLWTEGAAIGLFDRVELPTRIRASTRKMSVRNSASARTSPSIRTSSAPRSRSGATPSTDQDSLLPQISAGVQYKHNDKGWLSRPSAANRRTGTDFYVAATKTVPRAEPSGGRDPSRNERQPIRLPGLRRRQERQLLDRVRRLLRPTC